MSKAAQPCEAQVREYLSSAKQSEDTTNIAVKVICGTAAFDSVSFDRLRDQILAQLKSAMDQAKVVTAAGAKPVNSAIPMVQRNLRDIKSQLEALNAMNKLHAKRPGIENTASLNKAIADANAALNSLNLFVKRGGR